MYHTRNAAAPRKAMILMVVLALLTLFAIAGISFVYYADAAALSSRMTRDAESLTRPDMNPEEALALVLGQILYDVKDDSTGVYSSLRGHSLARNLYGYNDAVNNSTAFGGVGRLHYFPFGGTSPDDWNLVNYTYFQADGFLRDPERYGTRTGLGAGKGQFAGGMNPPYTYPDANHLYLGAVQANDGMVLAHSYHRDYLGFGSLDPSNPNWLTGNQYLKYMTLRPRPADNTANFPKPEDAGGDVKNLVGSPGYLDPSGTRYNNDSIWIDVSAPIMTAPDGRKYKMLVAPFITDLDGLLNINAVGNIRGTGNPPVHVSNQGWGPWEINPSLVLTGQNGGTAEWPNLFLGKTNPNVAGKYGPDQKPVNGGTQSNAGRGTHYYAQVDFDGTQGYNGTSGTPTNSPVPYPLGNNGTNLFPTFPAGYENGAAATERTDHPLLYNVFNPYFSSKTQYDRRFSAAHLERLLRFGDTGYQSLSSDLERASPMNFNNPGDLAGSAKRRRMVTTDSTDLIRPGLTPWLDPTTSGLTANATNLDQPPYGPAVPYPTLPPAGTPTAATSEFDSDWRAKAVNTWSGSIQTALSRINLNRALTPYPLGDPNGTPPNSQSTTTYITRFDGSNPAVTAQAAQALQDRQQFADDIYRRLLLVCGVPAVAAAGSPTAAELAPRRWLAQLAVNIVDYIDEDDIITPFNFYNANDGGAGFNVGATGTPPTNQGAPPATEFPLYWVFGTELPHVVLNEASVQTQVAKPGDNSGGGIPNLPPYTVAAWVELMNVLQAPPAQAPDQPQDGYPVMLSIPANTNPAYAPYHVVIAGGMYVPTSNENVLGTYNYLKKETADSEFTAASTYKPAAANTPGTQAPLPTPSIGVAPAGALNSNNFFLLAPPTANLVPAANFRDVVGTNNTTVPAGTPFLRMPGMFYPPVGAGGKFTDGTGNTPPDERTTGVTILLRRLANPHMPAQLNPASGNYNPYVTVDYIDKVPLRGQDVDGAGAAFYWNTRGKSQPFAGLTQLAPPANQVPNSPVGKVSSSSPVQDQVPATQDPNCWLNHTFGQQNVPLPTAQYYDCLVHLDRQVISPIELLQVSGYPPHLLTQKFISPAVNAPPPPPTPPNLTWNHRVPWFDETTPAGNSNRLYRLFEFLDTGNRPTWVGPNGRVPGKVNLNTVYDTETFQAVCDGNGANFVNTAGKAQTIFGNLVKFRTPKQVTYNSQPYNIPGATNNGGTYSTSSTPGTTDRPFLGLATGLSTGAANTQFLNDRGIEDTILRSYGPPTQTGVAGPRLLQDNSAAATHPYLQYQLLTKLFNNVTNRSNVFAVWLTVGFFEVTYSGTTPQLGAEIGKSEGRNIRHRMFAVVDRTNMELFRTTVNANINVPPATYSGQQASASLPLGVGPTVNDSSDRSGKTITIQAGMQLTYEPGGPNEETVVVDSTGASAVFTRSHTGSIAVSCRGNPGPWNRFDPRKDPNVVLHWSIVE